LDVAETPQCEPKSECVGNRILDYDQKRWLISYGTDFVDLYRRATDYVDRLKGREAGRPAGTSCDQVKLVINLKTAKALGLTIAPAVLARIDQAIE
jgi:putative tryptophan/tyrosine transport system substrate-binding protein